MAEIILTSDEEKAGSWMQLDDASLGKVVKEGMLQLKKISQEQDKLFVMAAATILCCEASEANADILKLTNENLTRCGEDIGNWLVTIKRLNK